MYRARFIADGYKDDPRKLGYIRVLFNGAIQRAYPCSPVMTLNIPSLEWIETYGDAFWCIVDPFEWDAAYPEEFHLGWFGMTPLEDATVNEENLIATEFMEKFKELYPHYRSPLLTENWTIACSDVPGDTNFQIGHSDGTSLFLNRKIDPEDEESVETGELSYTDAVLGSRIVFDKLHFLLYHGIHGHTVIGEEDKISIRDGIRGSEILMTEDEFTIYDGVRGTKIIISDAGISVQEGQSSKFFQIQNSGEATLSATDIYLEGENDDSGLTGVISTGSIDPFTGVGHIDGSQKVFSTGGHYAQKQKPPLITPEEPPAPPPPVEPQPEDYYTSVIDFNGKSRYRQAHKQWEAEYAAWEARYGT